MTCNSEVLALIDNALQSGARVTVTYDDAARLAEGREIVDSVQVHGLKGCGPFPMSAIAAAERLRELFGSSHF